MKILYYNWAPFDAPNNVGGGVTVYLKNLITYIIQNKTDEIYFLSGGWKYNPFKLTSYIEETKNIHQDSKRCRSFEIVNSPITAPQYSMFFNIEKYLNDTNTVSLFDNFIKKYGPFDIIHINNFEGISTNVLKLKEKYPDCKFIFSVHNYQPICPLVQYFQNHTKEICHNFNYGNQCLKCLNVKISTQIYINGVREYFKPKLKIKNNKLFNLIIKLISLPFAKKYIKKKNIQQTNESYYKYRLQNINLLNKYADKVIAVSNRVEDIVIQNGIRPEITKTLYIGTKFADNQLGKSNTELTKPFTIAYLGYARVDKGFWFLIDCLKSLPEELAAKIKVVLAVKGYKNAEKDLKNFYSYKVYDGYTHPELEKILTDVNLGIVPVLWEDNLPQVAIEMVANGVPILSSDFGGASELCNSSLFKFKGGNKTDFIKSLETLVLNPDLLNEYWKNHTGLTTMKHHINELYEIYHQTENTWEVTQHA